MFSGWPFYGDRSSRSAPPPQYDEWGFPIPQQRTPLQQQQRAQQQQLAQEEQLLRHQQREEQQQQLRQQRLQQQKAELRRQQKEREEAIAAAAAATSTKQARRKQQRHAGPAPASSVRDEHSLSPNGVAQAGKPAVAQQKPAAKVPAAQQKPAAEATAAQQRPAAEVPGAQQKPAAKAPAATERPAAEPAVAAAAEEAAAGRPVEAGAGAAPARNFDAAMYRQLSTPSQETLSQVEALERQCDGIEAQLNDVQAKLQAGMSRDQLLRLKQELAQSVGTVDKFQEEFVDAIVTADLNSGRAVVRQHRKALTQRVGALREKTVLVYREVERRANAA